MKIEVIGEHGYMQALYGLGLSRGLTSGITFDDFASDNTLFERLHDVAYQLCNHDTGENKFLESIHVWIDVTAPRYWWQQMDTYRVGITKQSESTVYGILKRGLSRDDFEYHVPDRYIEAINDHIRLHSLSVVKALLPEGFLQKRVMATNYKALRHIYSQRHDHKLWEWQAFCKVIRDGVAQSYFITSNA